MISTTAQDGFAYRHRAAKSAIVTRRARGIGRGIALLLANEAPGVGRLRLGASLGRGRDAGPSQCWSTRSVQGLRG